MVARTNFFPLAASSPEHMIGANVLRGHDSHGVGMIAMYAQYLRKAKVP